LIEESADGTFNVTFGGNTNRGQVAFGEKFRRFIKNLGVEQAKAL
jgi:hypothetical protein